MKPIRFIDTHCHLDMEAYQDDFTDIVLRAENSGISHIISIGIDYHSSQRAIELAREYSIISATVGVHPHDIETLNNNEYEKLQLLITENRDYIVGYGEIGLDYFKNYSDESLQRVHFAKQLELAKHFELPVIIHDRDAHDDILSILKEHGPYKAGGVLHCFSGDISFAEKVLKLGFYISIPGIVTFKNAKDLQLVAEKIPLSSMLLETDGPFLAPVPHRGKRNESSYIPKIAEKIAQLRNVETAEIAQATTANAIKLFNLNLPDL